MYIHVFNLMFENDFNFDKKIVDQAERHDF